MIILLLKCMCMYFLKLKYEFIYNNFFLKIFDD